MSFPWYRHDRDHEYATYRPKGLGTVEIKAENSDRLNEGYVPRPMHAEQGRGTKG